MYGSTETETGEEEYDQLSSDETLSEDYGAEEEGPVMLREKAGEMCIS